MHRPADTALHVITVMESAALWSLTSFTMLLLMDPSSCRTGHNRIEPDLMNGMEQWTWGMPVCVLTAGMWPDIVMQCQHFLCPFVFAPLLDFPVKTCEPLHSCYTEVNVAVSLEKVENAWLRTFPRPCLTRLYFWCICCSQICHHLSCAWKFITMSTVAHQWTLSCEPFEPNPHLQTLVL